MRGYICDQCGKREAADVYESLTPAGWFSLQQRPETHVHVSGHYCSIECLQGAITEIVLKQVEMSRG